MKRAWRLRRRTTPSTTATPEQLADVLDDVRRLRLTLTTDLSAVAGAIDEDTPSVVRDILEADHGELAELMQRNYARVAISPPSRPRRPVRRRALLALPAVPLIGVAAMTTAAALAGHQHGHVTAAPHNSVARQADATGMGDVATPTQTLLRLESVLSHDPKASEVLAITDQLHRQLATLVAASTNSPGQLSAAQRLLDVEQQLLEEHRPPGVAGMLAAAASLAKQLVRETELVTPSVHTPSPRATATPTTTPSNNLNASSQPTPTSTRHHHHHLLSPSPSSPSPTNSRMPTSPFPAPSNFSQGNL